MHCHSCLARTLPPKHNCYLHVVQRCACYGCLSGLSFITVVIQAHASWGSEKQSCTKILLRFRMRPAAIALNYSIKNIRNDVRQIVYICGSTRYKLNIIPLRILTALPCLKHCSTELPLRVGLIHAT